MIEIREYLDQAGRSPYGKWFRNLNAQAAAKIAIAVYRLERGNVSSVKGVGAGVSEYRIDTGPGYRIYFGMDGDCAVLLIGGSKRRQTIDIKLAKKYWRDYKRRR